MNEECIPYIVDSVQDIVSPYCKAAITVAELAISEPSVIGFQ